MFAKRLIAAIVLMSVASLFSVGHAVMPPGPDVDMPPHAIEAQKEISRSYGESGIARKLRRQAQELEKARSSGAAASPEATTITVPVIMGSYSGNAHIFTAPQFQTQLFGANPTGSMTSYYSEISYGNLTVTGTVFGPYTAAQNQAYYENGDNGFGNDYPTNAGGFIVSVLAAADNPIDFRWFDNDGPDGLPNSGDDDGFVDGLIVIFPDGDASGGDVDNIWAHKWNLQYSGYGSSYSTNDPAFGGGFIQIDVYTIQSAEQGDGTWNVIKPIGVYCHEFGHVLGLPDLYDTDNSSYGIGTHGLMASGSWGAPWSTATEDTPVHMCAWSKAMLGFLTPTVIVGTQAVSIPPVETTPTVYKLWDDAYQGGRYFLLENRTKTGFDQDFLGQGVQIWHCNDDIRFENRVDAYRVVDLEEADGLNHLDSKTNRMDAGDFYPGTSSNTSFTDFTTPSALDAYGTATGVSATGFAGPAGGNISVTLTQRAISGYTIALDTYDWTIDPYGYPSAQTNHGAVRFVAPSPGTLVAVQAGVREDKPIGYTVDIWNDMLGSAPTGFQSSTSGSFPDYLVNRYHEITLSSSLALSASQVFLVDIAFGPDTYAVPTTLKSPIAGNSYFSQTGAVYSPIVGRDVLIRARISTSVDTDGDGIPDASDNCPTVYNEAQADNDGDGVGNFCDNCVNTSNAGQGDSDGDGAGDLCDICNGFDDFDDNDIDNYPAGCDNCPTTYNPYQLDNDGDGLGNLCDNCVDVVNVGQADSDSDGRGDDCDVCDGGNDFEDMDGDGVPDFCDICMGMDDNGPDDDNDGMPNSCDQCPGEDDFADADGDGMPDACDVCPGFNDYDDADLDGVPDGCDICADGDDNVDGDADGEPDACDNCPTDYNPNQADSDNDGIGDVCDLSCCSGRVGDANGSAEDEPTIGDISVLIDAKFITGTCNGILDCLLEADINQSGGSNPVCDDITIGDISTLIDYLFITGPLLGLPNCL